LGEVARQAQVHRINQEFDSHKGYWSHILPRLRHPPHLWREIKQRAFVDFLVPTDGSIPLAQLGRFCHLLTEHPSLDIVKISDGLCDSFRYNRPLIESANVIIARECSTPEGLLSALWEPCTGIAVETHEADTKEFLPRIVELVQPLLIELATSWDSDVDLQTLVVEIATSAGMQDTFSEL